MEIISKLKGQNNYVYNYVRESIDLMSVLIFSL